MGPGRKRVLVVYKKSAYQIYVRERRHPRVASLLRSRSKAVSGMIRAHEDHLSTLLEVRRVLRELGARAVFRQRRERGSTAGFDLVVTVGGDGTLLWASQMVAPGCPVLAINSAPQDSVGYFCAASGDEIADVLRDALASTLRETELTRLQVAIDDKVVHARVLNDVLFSHYCPAATTRYALRSGGREEEHKSSGVWVATPAGSTAAIRSAGGRVLPIASRQLQFVVREPYAVDERRYRLLSGMIKPSQHIEIRSHMRAGRLYIDGPHVARPVEIGSVLRMSRSTESLLLLGFRSRRGSR
jgi:NAD+ kinase